MLVVVCWAGALAPGPVRAASPAVAAVDPADDPWLSEQGPAVPEPQDEPREQVVAAWREAPEVAYARAAALRRVRLELGLDDLIAPARVILEGATDDDRDIYTAFARDLAPGTPSIGFAHARALAARGDVGGATRALGAALASVALNLRAQLWLVENVTVVLLIVVLGAALGFIALSALQVFPHAAHDLGDLLGGRRLPHFARTAALAALLLVPLAVGEGVIGLALALFVVAYAYAKSHQRNVLLMAAALLVIGLHPLAEVASIATTLLDRDPVAESVMAVVAGVADEADVERLEAVADEDVAAAHALAYRARRYGLEQRSQEILDALGQREPGDGYVLAARGNIEMRRGHTDAAIDLYERAASEVDSATLLFDLSQAYAKAFRMEEYEATLVRAQRRDADAVAALSSLDDADLVADLPYPVGLLQDRFVKRAMSHDPQFDLAAVLAPGRLGQSWTMTAGAFGLAVLVGLLFAGRYDHSSCCDRCGHRICTRCEETVWSEEICEDCHHLFQYPGATDPSLRMARLQALSRREVRIDRIVLAGALLIPGVAGLAARRPDYAMVGLLLFGWIAAWLVWPTGLFEEPLLMGQAAILCLAIPGTLAIVGYGGVVLASLVARKNR
jgi:hypothetical protein